MKRRQDAAGSVQGTPVRICTTWGEIRVHCIGDRIESIHLPRITRPPQDSFALQTIGDGLEGEEKRVSEHVGHYLEAVFSGNPTRLPLYYFPIGTSFVQAVWRALQKVPCGKVTTYGEIARTIGYPKAARAVGQACGANPLPLLIPCHRVVATNGKLGGFSAGLAWKRLLLQVEGCLLFLEGRPPPTSSASHT